MQAPHAAKGLLRTASNFISVARNSQTRSGSSYFNGKNVAQYTPPTRVNNAWNATQGAKQHKTDEGPSKLTSAFTVLSLTTASG